MKNLIALFCFLLFAAPQLFAQNDDNSIPLSIAYVNYDIDGYGLALSTEKMLGEHYVVEAALTASKRDLHDQNISFSGFLSRRINLKSGFSPQFGVGVGVINTWIDDKNSTQHVDDVTDEGNISMTTSLKVSPFAWDFRVSHDKPARLFLDCIAYARYPDFKKTETHILFQLGGTYYFNYASRASVLFDEE